MVHRILSVQVAWLYAVGSALVLAAAFILSGGDGRARLGADVLIRARGGILTNVLTQSSCTNANGFLPCWAIGSGGFCVYCSVNTYTDVTSGSNGGYWSGGPSVSCGSTIAGVCNAALTCVPGNPTGICNPSPPTASRQ